MNAHPPRTTLPLLAGAAFATALLLAAGNAEAGRPRVSVGVQVGPVWSGYHHGGYGGWHGHGRGHGHWHGGLGLGLGLLLLAPPLIVAAQEPQPAAVTLASPPLPAQPARPDPVIYPRHGQDAQQTEVDRRDCNRWATTQPAALADAGVFHRAVEACMDGRGYTLR